MIDVVKVAKAVRKIMNLSEDDTFDIMPTVSVACAQLTDRLKKAENSKESESYQCGGVLELLQDSFTQCGAGRHTYFL